MYPPGCWPMVQVINEEIKDLLGRSGGGGVGESVAGGSKDGGGCDGSVHGGLPLRENLQGEMTVAGLSQHKARTTFQIC